MRSGRTWRRVLLGLAVVVAALVAAGTVHAFLTASATPGSSGQAIVGSIDPPTDVAVPAYSDTGSVALSWGVATLTGGGPVLGYYVTRTDSATHATDAACGSDSTHLIPTPSCTDGDGIAYGGLSNAPVLDGSYTYTVTAAYHLWRAGAAASDPVTVDTAPPTSTLTAPAAEGPFAAAAWSAGCAASPFDASDAICGTADGTGSSLAGVVVSVESTSGSTSGEYWGGSAFDQPDETGAALLPATSSDGYAHWTVPFPVADLPDGSYAVRVHASDAAGNVQATTTSQAFTIDTTAPTTTDDATAGWRSSPVTVTLSADDGAGSGVAATYVTTDGSTPVVVGGVPQGTTQQGSSVSLSSDGIYTIEYFSVDRAGNAGPVETAARQVTIDTAPPDPGAVATDGAATSGGTTFVAAGQPLSDPGAADPTVGGASSGVASVSYRYCSVAADPGGATCTTTRAIGTSSDGSGHSVVWDTGSLPDGPYRLAATVTDGAGNDATSPAVAVTVDDSAPTTTDDTGSIGSGWLDTPQTVTLTPSDGAGSGVAATYYTTDGSAPTTSSTEGTSVELSTDGIYTVEYLSVDELGNAESAKSAATTIRIDAHAPDAGAVVTDGALVDGGTTYVKTGQALTDTTAADPTVGGAASGVAEIAYYYCQASCSSTPGSDPASWTEIATPAAGAPYSVVWDSQALADGVYSLVAAATDAAGNTGYSGVRQVTVDNGGSTAAFTFPADGGFYDPAGWAAIAGTADDAAGPGVTTVAVAIQDGSGAYYDGAAFAGATPTFLAASGTTAWSYAVPSSALTDGDTYHLTVQTTDALGNVDPAAATRSFTYDTTAPSVSLTFPADGGAYEAAGWTAGAPILGTATDATSGIAGAASIALTITQTSTGDTWNGSAFAPEAATVQPDTFSAGVWTYGFPSADFPADGTYTVSVAVTDQAGNVGSGPASTFTYDPPPASAASTTTTTSTTITTSTTVTTPTTTASTTAGDGGG